MVEAFALLSGRFQLCIRACFVAEEQGDNIFIHSSFLGDALKFLFLNMLPWVRGKVSLPAGFNTPTSRNPSPVRGLLLDCDSLLRMDRGLARKPRHFSPALQNVYGCSRLLWWYVST